MDNIIDVLILVILALFTFFGAKRGFISEVSRIIGLIAGFVLANQFHNEANQFLQQWISNESVCNVISYLAIFIVVVFAVSIIASILQKFFEFILLGWLNRLLGLLLGFIKGMLIVSVLIFVIEAFPTTDSFRSRLENDSRLYNICNGLKEWVIDSMAIRKSVDDLQGTIKSVTDENHLQKVQEYLDEE
ncbi:MAG: CvpA family protein [Candidatus Marinimicrobia bacterium]|nr:CvpA family protein [Candidatus Neomarinimicrobiota bacterium]MBL7022896.1 CvpA family protein [Candidatus Neomarinimicrobiota bacterium]MBL7109215.1 CvpA family protein [Candidatus Neomarinimicrobiota bacterium]